MNPILKKVLQVAEVVAAKSVPGGEAVDAGIHSILDHPGQTDFGTLAQGVIQAVEDFDGKDVANEAQFAAGVAVLQQGFKMVAASLKDHSDGTPTPTPTVQ